MPDAKFVRIRHRDHYRQLLAEMWECGEPFTLIEHDVAPTQEQLVALDACSEPWCVYSYGPGSWVPTFGCVRFGRELILGTQGVWDNPWPWNHLDQEFATYARARGFRAHWHWPHVRHTPTGLRWEPSFEESFAQMEREVELLRFAVMQAEGQAPATPSVISAAY